MPSLRETQDRFTRALFAAGDADAAGVAELVPDGALSRAQRLDIYRNNVLMNYRNALRDTYPALVRLVGDDFFNAAARHYARTHPSTSADLHDYGGSFADFLQGFEPARALPYLPDVARLEWRMHRVFHAADATPLAPADFAGLDESRLPGLRLTLHPAAALLQSPYPVRRIWQICQPGGASQDTQIDLDEGGHCLLVIRREYLVHLDLLDPAEHALLAGLHDGQTLGQGVQAALDRRHDFDLGGFLARHVSGGTFAGLRD